MVKLHIIASHKARIQCILKSIDMPNPPEAKNGGIIIILQKPNKKYDTIFSNSQQKPNKKYDIIFTNSQQKKKDDANKKSNGAIENNEATVINDEINKKISDFENCTDIYILIRHGKGWHNENKQKKYFMAIPGFSEYGKNIDSNLLEEGVEDAKNAGKKLNQIYSNIKDKFVVDDIDLYCSDLQRTYQTLYLALKQISDLQSSGIEIVDVDSSKQISNLQSSGVKIVDVDSSKKIQYNGQEKKILILPCNHEVGDMTQCEGEFGQKFNISNENQTSYGRNRNWGELILEGEKVPAASEILCNFTPYKKFYNSESRNYNLLKSETREHCTKWKFPKNIEYVQKELKPSQVSTPQQHVIRGGKNVYIYPINYKE